MISEGPFREIGDPKIAAIEGMRKKIESEGKHGILIPEHAVVGDKIPTLIELLKQRKPKINFQDIVFYSLATGILKYQNQKERHNVFRDPTNTEYTYANEAEKNVFVIIKVPYTLKDAMIHSIKTQEEAKKEMSEQELFAITDLKNQIFTGIESIGKLTDLEPIDDKNTTEKEQAIKEILKALKSAVINLETTLDKKNA